MVADEIDATAVAVVGVELGRILVGERAELEDFGRAQLCTEHGEFVVRPTAALARQPLGERRVAGKEIVVGEFDRLVEDLVGRRAIGIESGAVEFLVRRGALRHGSLPDSAAPDCATVVRAL